MTQILPIKFQEHLQVNLCFTLLCVNQRPFRQKLATRQPAKIFDFRAVNFFSQPQPQIVFPNIFPIFGTEDECICHLLGQ